MLASHEANKDLDREGNFDNKLKTFINSVGRDVWLQHVKYSENREIIIPGTTISAGPFKIIDFPATLVATKTDELGNTVHAWSNEERIAMTNILAAFESSITYELHQDVIVGIP